MRARLSAQPEEPPPLQVVGAGQTSLTRTDHDDVDLGRTRHCSTHTTANNARHPCPSRATGRRRVLRNHPLEALEALPS